ncbi:Putative ribonuclease H protein [Dendrobium catenatum]|uniref:Ribonuclease H protein n=1 Tax=Dendrobium catenatum TaxID=906689 RepID=A0A2I0WNB1_9ASPA|nr:Putative ribonuclease H protein [Dendrobium catenatum]
MVAYWIRGSNIPKTILKAIAKVSSKFLYHGDTNSKRMHLMSWSSTTKPFSKGGLGIASLHVLKSAFNCRIILRMYNNKNPLSSRLKSRHTSPWKPCNSFSSGFWKSVYSTAILFKRNFYFQIAPDSPIDCYWDHWVLSESFSSLFPGQTHPLSCGSGCNLGNWILNGSWSLPPFLSPSIKDTIYAIPITHNCPYHITWDNNENASFKDFYN